MRAHAAALTETDTEAAMPNDQGRESERGAVLAVQAVALCLCCLPCWRMNETEATKVSTNVPWSGLVSTSRTQPSSQTTRPSTRLNAEGEKSMCVVPVRVRKAGMRHFTLGLNKCYYCQCELYSSSASFFRVSFCSAFSYLSLNPTNAVRSVCFSF